MTNSYTFSIDTLSPVEGKALFCFEIEPYDDDGSVTAYAPLRKALAASGGDSAENSTQVRNTVTIFDLTTRKTVATFRIK